MRGVHKANAAYVYYIVIHVLQRAGAGPDTGAGRTGPTWGGTRGRGCVLGGPGSHSRGGLLIGHKQVILHYVVVC
jgi:hypothetical protein